MDAQPPINFKPGEILMRKGREVVFIRYIDVEYLGRMAMVEYRRARKLHKSQEVVIPYGLKRKA